MTLGMMGSCHKLSIAIAISGEKVSESRRYSRMASTFTCASSEVSVLLLGRAPLSTDSVCRILRVHSNLPACENQSLRRVQQIFVAAEPKSVTEASEHRSTYMTGLNANSSSFEYPFWCMIFICFTMVDFPDSPEPTRGVGG